MAKVRKNDKRIIAVAAEVVGISGAAFFVEIDNLHVFVNHPESMKWHQHHEEIVRRVSELTGMPTSVT